MENTRTQVILGEDNHNDALLIEQALLAVHPNTSIQVLGRHKDLLAYLEGHEAYADRQIFPMPNVILLGFRCPLLDDVKTLRWIRARHEFDHIKVLVLSGEAYEREAKIARELGADCYKVKPCDFNKLVDIAREWREKWFPPEAQAA